MSFQISIGNPFIELQQVESTNNYATGIVHAGMAQGGTAVFAHHQTKGKGQRNRQWQGESGKNIALSVILQPVSLSFSQSFLLSMATAVGVHHFFSQYAGSETKVKWPNDLYWRDRKAGGILIENIVQGSNWKAAIVGIGININQTIFEELGTKPVSLKQITGQNFSPLDLAKQLCNVLTKVYEELGLNPQQIIDEYHTVLYKRGEKAKFKQGMRLFDAVVKKVTNTGELVVEHSMEEFYRIGEIEWIL